MKKLLAALIAVLAVSFAGVTFAETDAAAGADAKKPAAHVKKAKKAKKMKKDDAAAPAAAPAAPAAPAK